VKKTPIIPVRAGHWSRLPNRDRLLGTNAGPGSSTNRDRWVFTWPRVQRGGVGSLVPVHGTNRDRWSLHFVLFLYSGRVLCFFLFIYLVFCIQFNSTIYIKKIMKEPHYIYILHIMVTNILYTVSSVVLGRNLLQTVLTRI
jgi:hypothetical protein